MEDIKRVIGYEKQTTWSTICAPLLEQMVLGSTLFMFD